jgi:triphosphoribosyl-dephospho-CoA synthetase
MYEKTVTIFNYYESKTTGDAYWYPHVLSGVDLVTDKGAILKKYGPDATDNAQLHVRYTRLSVCHRLLLSTSKEPRIKVFHSALSSSVISGGSTACIVQSTCIAFFRSL